MVTSGAGRAAVWYRLNAALVIQVRTQQGPRASRVQRLLIARASRPPKAANSAESMSTSKRLAAASYRGRHLGIVADRRRAQCQSPGRQRRQTGLEKLFTDQTSVHNRYRRLKLLWAMRLRRHPRVCPQAVRLEARHRTTLEGARKASSSCRTVGLSNGPSAGWVAIDAWRETRTYGRSSEAMTYIASIRRMPNWPQIDLRNNLLGRKEKHAKNAKKSWEMIYSEAG